MAVTVTEYDQLNDIILNGLDWDTDQLKAALFTGTHTPDSTETSYDNLLNECTGTNYTAGGEIVPTVAISGGIVTADPVSWTDVTITVRYVVLYTTVTINTIANPVLLIYDLGSEIVLSEVPWSFSWASNQILQLS